MNYIKSFGIKSKEHNVINFDKPVKKIFFTSTSELRVYIGNDYFALRGSNFHDSVNFVTGVNSIDLYNDGPSEIGVSILVEEWGN